jgi:hypothetical protein
LQVRLTREGVDGDFLEENFKALNPISVPDVRKEHVCGQPAHGTTISTLILSFSTTPRRKLPPGAGSLDAPERPMYSLSMGYGLICQAAISAVDKNF